MHKNKIHQTYLRTFKLPNLIKNGILSNFDLHGWPSKSDTFWAMAVENSRICTKSSNNPEVREFATAIAQNISDLEGRPWKSKLFPPPPLPLCTLPASLRLLLFPQQFPGEEGQGPKWPMSLLRDSPSHHQTSLPVSFPPDPTFWAGPMGTSLLGFEHSSLSSFLYNLPTLDRFPPEPPPPSSSG